MSDKRMKAAEEELQRLDALLASKGLCRSAVPKDGSCAFRAVCEGALLSQAQHASLREQCVRYLRARREQYEPFVDGVSWERYLFELALPCAWAGNVELQALGAVLNVGVTVWTAAGETVVAERPSPDARVVSLAFSGGNHFDLVRSVKSAQAAQFFQQLVYKVVNKAIGLEEEWDLAYRNVPIEVHKREIDIQRRTDAKIAIAECGRSKRGKPAEEFPDLDPVCRSKKSHPKKESEGTEGSPTCAAPSTPKSWAFVAVAKKPLPPPAQKPEEQASSERGYGEQEKQRPVSAEAPSPATDAAAASPALEVSSLPAEREVIPATAAGTAADSLPAELDAAASTVVPPSEAVVPAEGVVAPPVAIGVSVPMPEAKPARVRKSKPARPAAVTFASIAAAAAAKPQKQPQAHPPPVLKPEQAKEPTNYNLNVPVSSEERIAPSAASATVPAIEAASAPVVAVAASKPPKAKKQAVCPAPTFASIAAASAKQNAPQQPQGSLKIQRKAVNK